MSFLRKLFGKTDNNESEERLQRIAEFNMELDRLDEKRKEEEKFEVEADCIVS